jgi:sporulation protein YlmC with PRC-barrel domain
MFKDDLRESENKDDLLNRENLTGINEESPMANTPVKVLTARSIIGDEVQNSSGEKLGEVNDIMLNLQTGCIEYVVLKFGGFIGIGSKLFAIPFKSLELSPDRKIFILDKDKDFLKNAPGFDKNHWPETNSRHWDEVGNYWYGKTGIPPIPPV